MCRKYCTSKFYAIESYAEIRVKNFFWVLFFFTYLIVSLKCAITKLHLDTSISSTNISGGRKIYFRPAIQL